MILEKFKIIRNYFLFNLMTGKYLKVIMKNN